MEMDEKDSTDQPINFSVEMKHDYQELGKITTMIQTETYLDIAPVVNEVMKDNATTPLKFSISNILGMTNEQTSQRKGQ